MSPLHAHPLAIVFTSGRADYSATPRHRHTPDTPPASRRGRRRPGRTLLATGAAVAFFGSIAAACGSDEAKGPSTASCDAAVSYASSFATAPQDPAEFGPFIQDQLLPLVETMTSGFSGDAATAAATLRDTLHQVAEAGDPSALESPSAVEARTTVFQTVHEDCDVERVDVQAVDWAFANVPDEIHSGRVSFAVDYAGADEHEMVVFRRNDGVTESLDELMELPGDEMMGKVTMTGVTWGSPGSHSYLPADLEPGTYFLLCFLPQHGDEDGMPHFMVGMRHTLEVV